ncbi:unnamed protein product [Orchesella dallaii]|uniref:Uncharacterized protein n=1 Tax=Orchesella dallaii TaxID=48710 RepID=A0ABP1S8Y4_9HEXA
MASRSECSLKIITVVWVSTFVIVVLVWVLTNILSSVSRDANGCIQYTYNNRRAEWECVKQKSWKWSWSWFIIFLTIWLAVTLIFIYIRFDLNIKTLRDCQGRRQPVPVLERPVIAISTVSREYNIGGTSANETPHRIALPPSEQIVSPPEDLPPSYNECVINMDANYQQSTSSLSRII